VRPVCPDAHSSRTNKCGIRNTIEQKRIIRNIVSTDEISEKTEFSVSLRSMLLKRWFHDSCHARCCCGGLSFDVALALLLWWGWRLWHLRRGRPRPPLRIWQWVLAVWLSILLHAAGAGADCWVDHRQAQQMTAQRLTHITLERPVAGATSSCPQAAIFSANATGRQTPRAARSAGPAGDTLSHPVRWAISGSMP
jgi:hypothetical protein